MSLCVKQCDLCVGYISTTFEVHTTKRGEVDGYFYHVLKSICEYMKIKCDFVQIDSEDWGADIGNGTWNGLVGAIVRGEIHTSIPMLTESLKRKEVLSFSSIVIDSGIVFGYSPELDKQMSSTLDYSFPLHVFSPSVWATVYLLVLSFGLLSFLHTLPNMGTKIREERPRNFLKMFIDSLLTSQTVLIGREFNCIWETKGSAKRVGLLFWALGSFIVCSMYSANLVSSNVSAQLNTSPFTTFEQLATEIGKGNYRFLTPSVSTEFFQDIISGKDETFRNLKEGYFKYGVKLYSARNETLIQYFKVPNNYIIWESKFDMEILERMHPCYFTHTKFEVGDVVSYPFPKRFAKENATFLKKLDDAIQYHHQSHIIEHIIHKYTKRISSKKSRPCEEVAKRNGAQLGQLLWAGSIYASGITMSIAVFFFTLIYNTVQSRKPRPSKNPDPV